MYRTSGEPKKDVTILMFSSTGASNIRESRSQKRQKIAPEIKEAGVIKNGSAVLNIFFAQKGAAIPIKEMGPANAVTVAERVLDKSIRTILKKEILRPMDFA